LKLWIATVALFALTAGALVAGLTSAEGDGDHPVTQPAPGQPTVSVISPRNGSIQPSHAVVVKVDVRNFHLAPRQFGSVPQLGEGHIRFALNRVPDCVEKAKLERALNRPTSSGRLIGRSYDFPRYSGPNGVLAQRTGTVSLYSPATRPQIFYQRLPRGFYRLVITLAENNGASTPFHAVTTFEIVRDPGSPAPPEKDCRGKVSSVAAAEAIR